MTIVQLLECRRVTPLKQKVSRRQRRPGGGGDPQRTPRGPFQMEGVRLGHRPVFLTSALSLRDWPPAPHVPAASGFSR